VLGNDVVDLGDPETRPDAAHPRFDARVFTTEERAALAASPDPVRLRWRLWAAKEAAYKCSQKVNRGTFFESKPGHADARMPFLPARLEVRLDDAGGGSVQVGDRRLRIRFHEAGDALHAVASDAAAGPERRVLRALAKLPAGSHPSYASAEVRVLARELAAAHLGCEAGEIEVEQAGRVPRLRRRGAPLGLDLSLAHHGRYLAVALEAPAGEGAR
jgi:hypothetical protein